MVLLIPLVLVAGNIGMAMEADLKGWRHVSSLNLIACGANLASAVMVLGTFLW